jgi:hypothetical protein
MHGTVYLLLKRLFSSVWKFRFKSFNFENARYVSQQSQGAFFKVPLQCSHNNAFTYTRLQNKQLISNRSYWIHCKIFLCIWIRLILR